jgi:hypothetical protein
LERQKTKTLSIHPLVMTIKMQLDRHGIRIAAKVAALKNAFFGV